MRLQDKVCVITGAGSGIGEAAAKLFVAEGAHVVILELNEAAGQGVADAIGCGTVFIQTDISDHKSVERAFDQIKQQYKRLDVLYNNASLFLRDADGPIDSVDSQVWSQVLAVNLTGLMHCCRYGIPLLRQAGRGAIINTSSSAAVIGVPGCAAYTASKGAVLALTREMAIEYGPENIRTNCIAPAGIMTPMVAESNLKDQNFDESDYLKRHPLRRWGQPEDIAALAIFLASDESAYLNGAVVVADGASTIRPFFI